MNVLLITHEYPPYMFGGVASLMRNLALHLVKNGVNVIVICGRSTKTIRLQNDYGIKVIRIPFPDIPPRTVWFSLFGFRLIERLVKNINPITIITNASTISLILDKLKAHTIIVFHGSLEANLVYYRLNKITNVLFNPIETAYHAEMPLVKALIRKDIKFSSKMLFVAKHAMIETVNHFPDLADEIHSKGTVIYPGIEYEALSKLYYAYNNVKEKHKKLVIAFVGRLYFTKGITYAIETIDILVNELSVRDLKFWVFGDGPLQKWLKKYIKKKKLENYVTHYGFLRRERLHYLMAKYVDVLLFPSLYEGCPYAVLEANALGIPVITFDLPWSREFIINGLNGYRVQAFNSNKLAETILKTFDINRDKIVEYAKKFDIENSIGRLLHLINEVSQGN